MKTMTTILTIRDLKTRKFAKLTNGGKEYEWVEVAYGDAKPWMTRSNFNKTMALITAFKSGDVFPMENLEINVDESSHHHQIAPIENARIA